MLDSLYLILYIQLYTQIFLNLQITNIMQILLLLLYIIFFHKAMYLVLN